MASTKKTNVVKTQKAPNLLEQQIEQLSAQLKQKLTQYKNNNGKDHPISVSESNDYDYINPTHYVADDGRQTWERMVDKWGERATALWCEMTAFKYTDTRIGNKPNEDTEREMKKVEWYMNKAAELNEIADKKEKKKGFFNI
jgi:hypothetical protein